MAGAKWRADCRGSEVNSSDENALASSRSTTTQEADSQKRTWHLDPKGARRLPRSRPAGRETQCHAARSVSGVSPAAGSTRTGRHGRHWLGVWCGWHVKLSHALCGSRCEVVLVLVVNIVSILPVMLVRRLSVNMFCRVCAAQAILCPS